PFDWLHPDDVPMARARFAALAAGRGVGTPGQLRLRKADGSARMIEVVAHVERDANGEIRRLVTSTRDVTQRRAMEAQLRHAQRLEAVGGLTGGIAHDFNNILQGVLGNVQLGAERATPEGRVFLDIALRAA